MTEADRCTQHAERLAAIEAGHVNVQQDLVEIKTDLKDLLKEFKGNGKAGVWETVRGHGRVIRRLTWSGAILFAGVLTGFGQGLAQKIVWLWEQIK